MDSLDAYRFAEGRGYDIEEYHGPLQAFSLPVDGVCAIAFDPDQIKSSDEACEVLFHELGHCETLSFYYRGSCCAIREKQENKADRWAVKKLLPKEELEEAVRQGNREAWQLAEYLGRTEAFVRKAIELYQVCG